MRLKAAIFLVVVLVNATSCKRSRGRSRGSSSSSSGFSFWNRKSKTETTPEIKKQASPVQQAPAPPIGWNVNNGQKSAAYPVQSPPSYQQSVAGYPNQAPPAYQPAMHAPPAYNYAPPSYQQGVGGYPQHAPPAYNYQQGMGGYPQHAPPAYQHYPPSYGYPQQSKGIMGSFMGGKNYGGSYGSYGYGMKKSGGFFGKHAFRNVLGGLFVWYMVSGLVRRPYKVYNYYNQPREEREEITLPANVVVLCNENATNVCVPGTTAICTQDGKVLCVSTMNSAQPCQNNTGEMCVDSVVPCLDANDPLCQNKTSPHNTTTVNVPCFTNMTLDGAVGPGIGLPGGGGNKFCVTTMAVPDPTLKEEDDVKSIGGDEAVVTGNGTSPPLLDNTTVAKI